MTVPEALEYLHSLQQFGFKPGLESTRRLAALVGNPQDRLDFIHVAGTNGKGSVCAMLESVYRTSGLRVGLYTSPHLIHFGERIQVDRQPLAPAALARLTAALKAAIDRENQGNPALLLQPTFFEFTTVLALMSFLEQKVDLVIWETGLGGRWDATNIVTPLASVITNVSLDHQQILGHTTAAIAAEKAGIIKPEVPILTATANPDARAIIEFRAREISAPYLEVGASGIANFHQTVGLAGTHQRTNAALAAATIRALRARLPVSDEQLASGLANVQWPGRLQQLRRGNQLLVLDGAHNPAGVAALANALQEIQPGRRPTLILGMLADKDWREMATLLTPLAGRIIVVPVDSPRTVAPEALRAACLAAGVARPVKLVDSLGAALKASSRDPFVLITGSLYLVGEALKILEGSPTLALGEPQLNHWNPPATALAR